MWASGWLSPADKLIERMSGGLGVAFVLLVFSTFDGMSVLG